MERQDQLENEKDKNDPDKFVMNAFKRILAAKHRSYYHPYFEDEEKAKILNYLLSDKNMVEWGRFKDLSQGI